MNNKPLVSIIIPTYNRQKVLSSAIESALNQTYPNKQVIVVDDGSTDDTLNLVQSYPDVKYILQPHTGHAAARNNGLKNADGFYIASLDSDDVWNPDFLERCITVLEEQELDFVFTAWMQELKNNEWKDSFSDCIYLDPYYTKVKNADNWIILNNLDLRSLYTRYCPSPSSSAVMRRSSMVSGWNEQINIGDDWCMFLDMILAKECKAAFTYDTLWRKQINVNNILDGRNINEVLDLLYIEDVKGLIHRYSDTLTKPELKSFQETVLHNSIKLAVYRLSSNYNIVESYQIVKQANRTNPVFALLKHGFKLSFSAIKRLFVKNTQKLDLRPLKVK